MNENDATGTPAAQVDDATVTNDALMLDVGDESLQLATDPATPQKERVLVSKDVQLPHGKRLKRTVRTEHRKIPVPDEVMRKYELDLSTWECKRVYKSIDRTLLRTEQVDELVSRIMLTPHYREGLSNVDETMTVAMEYLANAESDPTPRPNPENKALRQRAAELRRAKKAGDAELAAWKRGEDRIEEMERNPTVLPECRSEPIRISSSAEAKNAFEKVLLLCSEADQRLNKVEMRMAVAQEKQKEFVKRFNQAVREGGVRHVKTPRRPAVFRGGATIADITPRAD